MRICLVGGARFGVGEPAAGGLETLVTTLARGLAGAGHDVTVLAGSQNDDGAVDGVEVEPLCTQPFRPSADARNDVSMPPDRFIEEHHAYASAAIRLRHDDFDIVHNHSLHYLPPMFDMRTPMVHTLHSPPTPWLESAFACAARPNDIVVSVSRANASRWGGLVDRVVHNGVDTDRWTRGRGRGGYAVWTGRVVPEKSPHLAIDAARTAGIPLRLAGPLHDPAYFSESVLPRLGDGVEYCGHLDTARLVSLVGSAAVAVVTPSWEEPYGLVVAEALACGTPVAAFARGAIPEIVDRSVGSLADPDDVDLLASAIRDAVTRRRSDCRRWALRRCSAAAMTRRYQTVYRAAIARHGG